MEKKAQTGAIVGIIIGVIIFALIGVGLIIANQKGYFKKTPEVNQNLVDMYLKAIDESNNQINANYVLSYLYNGSNLVISSGNLTNSLTEVKSVPVYSLTSPIQLSCWSNDYYYRKTIKFFDLSEINSNTSKAICPLEKIGNINVFHTGELKNEMSKISLNISTKNHYKKLSICTSWTPGIIYVSPKDSMILCEYGNWVNWSYYNATTKSYTYYENDYYRCGDVKNENLEQCESVLGNRCQSYSMNTPIRYTNKVDNCFYTGKSLKDESVLVEFDVKTSNLNQLDEITFYLMDQDRRWNEFEQMWTWETEKNNVNIGAEDTKYVVGLK